MVMSLMMMMMMTLKCNFSSPGFDGGLQQQFLLAIFRTKVKHYQGFASSYHHHYHDHHDQMQEIEIKFPGWCTNGKPVVPCATVFAGRPSQQLNLASQVTLR